MAAGGNACPAQKRGANIPSCSGGHGWVFNNIKAMRKMEVLLMNARKDMELNSFQGFEKDYILFMAGKIERSHHWGNRLNRACGC
jgi:hypothetical protein